MCEQLRSLLRQIDLRNFAFQHRLPVGPVGDKAFERDFQEAGLITRLDFQYRQGLAGALINPAGRDLGRTGDADFGTRRIRQIHVVRNHTVAFPPVWLATGAEMVVTRFGLHDAHIASG